VNGGGPAQGVLLVEADTLVRGPLADYLRECGYRVLEVSTTGEARELLESLPNAIHVALVDAQAQDETGFGLAAWLRRDHPDVDVVLTGAAEHAARKAAELCDDGPLPSRPYDHRQVLERIRRLASARDRRRGG
jgi:DNA-binding response OmpR family regulator